MVASVGDFGSVVIRSFGSSKISAGKLVSVLHSHVPLNFSGPFSAPLTWHMSCGPSWGPPGFHKLLYVSLLASVLPLFYGNSLSFAPAATALLVLRIPTRLFAAFQSRLTAVAARLGDTAWMCMEVWNISLPPIIGLKCSRDLCLLLACTTTYQLACTATFPISCYVFPAICIPRSIYLSTAR